MSARSIDRQIRNVGRRARRLNPSLESIFAALDFRRDNKDARLRDKFNKEESVQRRAEELFKAYSSKGCKWSECVQAVKTEWVTNLHTKYSIK